MFRYIIFQESQGFTRTDSNSRLVYTYNSRNKHPDVKIAQKSLVNKENVNVIPEDEENIKFKDSEESAGASVSSTSKIVSKFENSTNGAGKYPNSPKRGKPSIVPNSPSKHVKSASIADKAAIFEISSPSKTSKDPALLSVSERKALFEKNKGEVLVPKAPFGMAPPVKVESVMKVSRTKIITDNNSSTNKANNDKFSKTQKENLDVTKNTNESPNINKITKKNLDVNKTPEKTKKPIDKPVPKKIDNAKPIVHEVIPKSTEMSSERDSPTIAMVQQSGGIASRVAALMQNKSTISESQIENSIKSQRQKEMDMLLNRFNKNKEVINTLFYQEYNYFNYIYNLIFLIQIVNDIILEEESESEDSNATEDTAMLREKGPKIVITNDTPRRKSAEKRKSGSKVCSRYSFIFYEISQSNCHITKSVT